MKDYRAGSSMKFVWDKVRFVEVGGECVITSGEMSERSMTVAGVRAALNKVANDHSIMFVTRLREDELKITRIK